MYSMRAQTMIHRFYDRIKYRIHTHKKKKYIIITTTTKQQFKRIFLLTL